jgi:hypothetical protein
MFCRVIFKVSYKQLRGDSVDNKKNKQLVLTVVNGVAKWVDVRDASERFVSPNRDSLTTRYFIDEQNQEPHLEELE